MKNARIPARREGPLGQTHDEVYAGDRLLTERLLAAFEHLRESIVLTDPEDRFLLTNRAFRDLNQNVAHAIRPGEKFEDYMRAGIAAGNYPDSAGREEEWLAARLAERRNPGKPVERQRNGGRWFMIDDRRLPDGSTIRFGTEITERKRAEAALNERNRELQLVVDSVPVMITRFDRDERFLFANRAYTALMERSAEDTVGRRVADVVSPEAYARIKPALKRALSGDPVSVERIQQRPNGERVEVEGRYIPDVDVRGRVIGVIAVHRDVTAERQTRRSLAASEARFRALTYLSSDFFWETGADLRYTSFAAGPRYKPAQPLEIKIGKSPWEISSLFPDTDAWHRHRERMRAREPFRDFLVIRPADDGSERAFRFSGDPRHDAEGEFIGYHGIGRDVTDAWRAEKSLAESEARFRNLTELSSDWYWEQDDQFRQTFLSDGYDAPSGAQRTRTLGTKRWERPGITPLTCSWEEHKAVLEAHLPFKDFEYLREASDGRRVYVSLCGTPVFDGTGRFLGYRGIGRNITGRKRDEQLLRIEHQVTRALSEAEDVASGVKAVLRVVCEAENMCCGRYFRLDDAAGVLRYHDGWCLPEAAHERFLEHSRALAFRPGEGLAGIVWQTGEPVWSSDTSRDPRVLGKSLARNSNIRGAFAFGVLAEGKVFGVLSFSGQTAREPDQRLLQAARVIGSQIGQFLQRKQAEKSLRDREQMLAALLRNMPGDVYRCRNDRDWTMEYVSEGVLELTGYPPSAFTFEGRVTYGSLVHPEDRDRIWREAQAALAERRPYMLEYRICDARGAEKWVWERGFGDYAEDGSVLALDGFVADITQRKLAEEALRVQTERLKIGQSAGRMIVLDWDICNDHLEWSDSPEWLRGPLPPDGKYPPFKDQVHPDDRENFLATRAKAIHTLQGETPEFRFVRTDGRIRWMQSRQKLFPDESGNAKRMLVALHDITERKEREQALAESEARFRAIFERSNAGMAITDASGTYLSVNVAFARFFGYSAEEIVGKLNVSDLRSAEDVEGALLYQQLVSGKVDFFERDRPYRRKDGVQIWGRVTASAVRDAGGKASYVVAVFSDITEEVLTSARAERMNTELEERVEIRTAELREAMKELDAFTYSVSHDLRAPIGAVSGFAHLLRNAEAARLSEDGRRLLGFIEQNAERMTRLIEGLLRFSRLGRSELRRSRVSMSGLAGESLMDFVDEAARASISAGAMPDCSGDPALLGQVWSNLLGNALKYSRVVEGPRIDIGWDAARGAYYVRDNGIGFDMAHAGKLFGVFERLHSESEFEGSGIGLAIAERIVRLHGGAIWADAAPGRGATFWVTGPPAGGGAAPEIRSSADAHR